MNWKDYFYFQKREQTAIIILLTLIIISGGVYIATKQKPYTENTQEGSAFEKEFEVFRNNLKEEEAQTSGYPPAPDRKYPYQVKLKAGETIELNLADTSVLKKIPGIGSAFSNRIVKYKNLLGGYSEINQLKEVWGIDEELYSKITPFIALKPGTKKLRINSASFQELNKHPYLNYKQTKAIVDIRERKGKIESVNRLSLLEEFSEADIKRLTPYLSFD